jgi:uncharacterized membrane protein
MDPIHPDRDAVQTISRHSNLSAAGIRDLYRSSGILAGRDAWPRFLQVALIALGSAFFAAGVIFFFAYNWSGLHRFVKLGIMEGLLVALAGVILFARLDRTIKNILLTGASLLVGGLFAVYGQIYQTGADAYDFFLGWSVFIALWAFISGFPPLWLLLLGLVNATILLYGQQVADFWSETDGLLILFLIDAAVVVAAELALNRGGVQGAPGWFVKTVALAAVGCATLVLVIGIFDHYPSRIFIALPAAALFFGWSIRHGLRRRNAFYLTVIPLAVIIIISAFLLNLGWESGDAIGIFFLVSLFIIVSTTLVIRQILHLNKQWHGNAPD